MKATFAVAAAVAVAGGASASKVHHRHAHDLFQGLEKKSAAADNGTCVPGCTTIWSTWYGEATLYNPPPPSTSSVVPPTTSSSAIPITTAAPSTSSAPVLVPTPIAQTCPTPGVYTFPATTVTLTETTTVCGASTTALPSSGTYTLGGVTTVVETATTIVCPYATVSTSGDVTTSVIKTTTYVCPSAGTYTIAPVTTTVTCPTTIGVPVVSTYTPGVYTQPETVTTVVETSTVIYCPFSAVPTATAVSTAPVSTSSLTGNGKAPWGMTYTPYENNGDCKTEAAVAEDIAEIAALGIKSVRVYSTDCDTLPFVGNACKANGLTMILGVFMNEVGCNATSVPVTQQVKAIKEWAQWDLVDLIAVGNEAMLNGYCTAQEIATLIGECKSEFTGYTGPYTTTDTVNIWQDESVQDVLCDVVDIVGAQAHAFFNTDTVATDAGSFVKGQLDIVNNVCSGKEARILETGWPSAGVCMGVACPGETEQAQAIASLIEEVADYAVFFSLTNDDWKSPNTECECEQYFGCGSAVKSALS
ncbi:glycoside hydrolase superfamily [Xylariales sp. PMI_506]|nr:glycoside hydrolase superfamily [Xylariales sp. PMI_506]